MNFFFCNHYGQTAKTMEQDSRKGSFYQNNGTCRDVIDADCHPMYFILHKKIEAIFLR